MKRNSNTLHLTSPGATTPIPWVNNAPDFSQFSEPTLSVLQNSWQSFLDSRAELEVIPDPEPYVEHVVPDWDGFYDSLLLSSVYNHLLSQTIPYPSISGVMAVMGFAIQDGRNNPSSPGRLQAFQASVYAVLMTLSAVGIPLNTEQLTEVRTLLDSNGFQSIALE
jgi:hypothetical protein